jgi:hypothetical protein
MNNMGQKLKVYKINSVDLVDEGSCGAAHITLIKRKEGGSVMTFEELKKSLTPEEITIVDAEIVKAKGEIPAGFMSPEDKKKLEDDKAAADVAKATAEGEVVKMKAEIEILKKSTTPGQSEEDILKGADLSPAVRAILESNINKAKAAEIAIMKMQETTEAAEFIAKAKEVAFVPEADTKVVNLLKSVKGVAGAGDMIMDILKSVNTLVAKGAAFNEFGTSNQGAATGGSEEAWAAIEKAASELVTKGTAVSKAKAIDMIMVEQPALYKTYVDALRNE